ncbi:MAG: hypothetical protein ACPG4T_05710, partial [Nannocystaceae bacterium]
MPAKAFWRRALVSLALTLAVASPAGCHHKLPRLAAMGKHAEVIERVQNSRRLPRGKAGRAYASSLAAVGRVDEARAYFMWDFRHTGDTRSLVALGDLEVQNGLRGIALTRYARAHSLNSRALRGRGDVCDLLRDRARQFLAEGEGIAADQDFRRVASVCPAKAKAELQLQTEIASAAAQQARAQRTLEPCSGRECPQVPGLAEQLAQARKSGPMALASVAHQQGVELPAADVVALLEADLAGQLGVDLLTHDQLRAWIGRQPLDVLQQAIVAHPSAAVQAYADLRLSLLGPAYALSDVAAPSVNQDVLRRADGQVTSPAAPSGGANASGLKLARVLERLSEQGEIPPSNGWRVLALVGDLRAVEFELGTGLRSQSPPEPVPAASDGMVPGAAERMRVHWAATGPVNYTKLIDLLTLARLRATSENADQALEIARFALANAHQNGVAEAVVLARQEAWQRLASGQPWQAIAVMEAIANARDRGIERAAGTAIALTAAVCGSNCTASDDRGIATRVMGDAWITSRQKELLTLARRRSVQLQASDACPTLRELLVGDAVGPLAEALRAARADVTAPGVAEALRTAVESDLTLTCAGRHAAAVMLAGGHRVSAEVIADALAQAPQIVAAGQLEFQAELAVIAQRGEQAELISQAAGAASVAPQAYWRRAALFGKLADARDFEAHSLRQAIAHAPDANAPDLRQALAVRTLLDASLGEALREPDVPAAREALFHQTSEYFDSLPVAARWQARERVAAAVAANGTLDDTALQLIRQALWPESLAMMRHPAALAALEQSRDQPMFELTPEELAPKQW